MWKSLRGMTTFARYRERNMQICYKTKKQKTIEGKSENYGTFLHLKKKRGGPGSRGGSREVWKENWTRRQREWREGERLQLYPELRRSAKNFILGKDCSFCLCLSGKKKKTSASYLLYTAAAHKHFHTVLLYSQEFQSSISTRSNHSHSQVAQVGQSEQQVWAGKVDQLSSSGSSSYRGSWGHCIKEEASSRMHGTIRHAAPSSLIRLLLLSNHVH